MTETPHDTSHYDTHRVSCKIALFNTVRTKVLLTTYENSSFSIPGGHIDGREAPEEALLRELKEELGIEYDGPMTLTDVFRSRFGKLVIGYVGELAEDVPITIPDSERHGARWEEIERIKSGATNVGDYISLILAGSK